MLYTRDKWRTITGQTAEEPRIQNKNFQNKIENLQYMNIHKNFTKPWQTDKKENPETTSYLIV